MSSYGITHAHQEAENIRFWENVTYFVINLDNAI